MKRKYGFRWSQEIIRMLCYFLAVGYMLESLWFLPLSWFFIFLAHIVEGNETEIKQLTTSEGKA